MKSFRLQLMIFLFICTTLFATSSGATNFYERHGNNFIYLDSMPSNQFDTLTYAPVIWDIGTAFFELRNYYASYGWESSSGCDSSYNAIDLLMKEAWDHGVNFANARGEILRMATPTLDSGPEPEHYFVNVAEIVREDSLHLIAGGFKTDTTVFSYEHNDAVISYLSEYMDYDYTLPDSSGDFIGVFGFDEPDLGYEGPGENQCLHDTAWSNLVENYAQLSRDSISGDILPFGTFVCRWKTQEGDSLWYRETIPLFSGELEYPVFDYYPCKYSPPDDRSYPDQIEFDEIIGATNLMPSGSIDYEAYADQDEIFAVDDSGWFRVFEFENVTSRTDTLEVSRIDSVLLPQSLRNNPVWAASDFRAADVGDRDSHSHKLNGAVVFFDKDDPGENMVIFHNGTDLVFLEDILEMPANAWEITTACVGEYNYPVHHPTDSLRRGSLISHGELRILVCYQIRRSGQFYDRARIFAWNYTTEEFNDVTGDTLGLRLDIKPAKAVWGVFWPTDNGWSSYNSDDQSGFIMIDSSGNYQSIYEYVPQGINESEWAVSDEFTNLFEWDETSFIARQTKSFPCFTAGMDYICHLTAGVLNKAVLEFASNPGRNPNSALTVYESSPFDLPESYDFFDINDAASFRPMRFYDDALLVSFDYPGDSSEVYRSTGSINFRGGDDISISMDTDAFFTRKIASDESPLLAAARVYNVRQTYREPLVSNPDIIPYYPFQFTLLYSDIPVESSSDFLAEMHVAMDTMFVYGIDSTSRSNCLMHNLRCEGRRQDGQVTFYPSSDTLLYLMTTSLVHGSRGIHMRALNFTMMCGNGGSSAPSGTYRCPPLLLNWGPSVETTNPDMLGRLHDVVQSLTGKNTSNPDFVSALIDDNYEILDTADVRNAIQDGGWHQDTENDYLNFIALEDSVSGDILLLVVNDSSEDVSDFTYIRFPNRYKDSYTANWVAGFKCLYDPEGDRVRLVLDFYTMLPYTASLYWFEHK
ncbi:MAG: hypothetical protein K8R76_13185 [Candidatus Aegiribacteria sp.]|nr:hypothetical protein [Candidatus Aegiribacteria sp.]